MRVVDTEEPAGLANRFHSGQTYFLRKKARKRARPPKATPTSAREEPASGTGTVPPGVPPPPARAAIGSATKSQVIVVRIICNIRSVLSKCGLFGSRRGTPSDGHPSKATSMPKRAYLLPCCNQFIIKCLRDL